MYELLHVFTKTHPVGTRTRQNRSDNGFICGKAPYTLNVAYGNDMGDVCFFIVRY